MGFERLIFVSGQGATDPATGTTRRRRRRDADRAVPEESCRRSSKAGGSDLQHVLRCGVFLIDMKEFQQMNAVYSRMFGDHRPARTTIQAAGLPGRRTAGRNRLHRLRSVRAVRYAYEDSSCIARLATGAGSLRRRCRHARCRPVGHANEGFWPFNRIPQGRDQAGARRRSVRSVDPARAAGVGAVPERIGIVRLARRPGAHQSSRLARPAAQAEHARARLASRRASSPPIAARK